MNGYGAVPEYDELESYMYRDKRTAMDREDRKMTREEAQRVLNLLAPGFKLPPPRTEEEFLAATRPINPKLEELETQIRSETIITMYLMDQLNAKKKLIHELYEKERALKNEMA